MLSRDFIHSLPWNAFTLFCFFFLLLIARVLLSSFSFFPSLLGCPASPVKNSISGRLWRKTVIRGREETRVWYRETMFSQMVSYRIFSCTNPCTDSFCTSSPLPLKKNTRRCEPEEGYLRCSKRFDHGSHSIIFLLFAFKSIHVPRATRLNL